MMFLSPHFLISGFQTPVCFAHPAISRQMASIMNTMCCSGSIHMANTVCCRHFETVTAAVHRAMHVIGIKHGQYFYAPPQRLLTGANLIPSLPVRRDSADGHLA